MQGTIPFRTSQQALELARQARGLRSIADGLPVNPHLCEMLKKAGLISEGPTGWALTQQGKFALAFAAAH